MLHLMKYEWKKTFFLKLLMLAVIAVGEIIFLAGISLHHTDFERSTLFETSMIILALGLSLSPVISILQDLSMLQRELNSKESYMLYLTPHSSFEILGAKCLVSLLEIIFWAVLAAVLFVVDGLMLTHLLYGADANIMGRLAELLQLVTSAEALTAMLQATLLFLAGLLQFESIALIAIVLQATFLHGIRFSGIITVILYILLAYFSSSLLTHLPFSPYMLLHFAGSYITVRTISMVIVSLILSAVYFVIAALLLEKKRNI